MAKKSDLPEPKKVKALAMPEETIAIALKNQKGLQYLAAEELDMAVSSLSERIKNSPYLQAVQKNCIERRIDIAEKSLSELTEEKNLGSICFLLKTLGKSRGYVEDKPITIDPHIEANHEALMKQIDKLQHKEIPDDV